MAPICLAGPTSTTEIEVIVLSDVDGQIQIYVARNGPKSFKLNLDMVHQVVRLLHLKSHLDVFNLNELSM